jgi:hypothetical protein
MIAEPSSSFGETETMVPTHVNQHAVVQRVAPLRPGYTSCRAR